VLVRKSKQFFSDYNRGRRFFFASFPNCSYVWIIEIEDWPAHPGRWRIFGCGTEDVARKPSRSLRCCKRLLNFSFKELREYLEFETDELINMIGPFGDGLAKRSC